MATPAVIGFHNATAIEERAKVRFRIQQGTKASSPQVRSYRRQHLDIYQPHATLPDNSTGSKNRPFYASKGEKSFSLEDKMSGGVLSTKEGQKYGKFILNRRANDIRAKELVAQGIEPSSVMPTGDLVLTPDESKSLELNNLLQGVSDAIEASDFSGLTINDLKNIPRLMITTLPKMTQQNFGELVGFIEEMVLELEAIINPKEDIDDDRKELVLDSKSTNGAKRIYEYLSRLIVLLRDFAKVMGRDEATKVVALRALVNEYLGIRKTTSESIVPNLKQEIIKVGRIPRPGVAPPRPPPPPSPPSSPPSSAASSRAPSAPSSRAPSVPPSPRPRDEEREEEEDEEDEDSPPRVVKRPLVVKAVDAKAARLAAEAARLAAEARALEEAAPAVSGRPNLSEAERKLERELNNAYNLTKSKVVSRSQKGFNTLRAFLDQIGVGYEADASRTKLKNAIEKNSKYYIY